MIGFAGWLMHCTMYARRRRRAALMMRARLSHRRRRRGHQHSKPSVLRLITWTMVTRLRRILDMVQIQPKSQMPYVRSHRSAVKSLTPRLTPVATAA